MPSASTGCPVHDPIAHVDVVDVLLDDMIAREPGKVVPVVTWYCISFWPGLRGRIQMLLELK